MGTKTKRRAAAMRTTLASTLHRFARWLGGKADSRRGGPNRFHSELSALRGRVPDCLLESNARLPGGRIACGVKDRDDYYFPRFLAVKDNIGEPCNDGLANVLVHFRMHLGVGSNASNHVPNLGKEVPAESRAALLVPVDGIVELIPGFGEKPNWQSHRRRRARASASTCSQGMAAVGLARCAARRRSISCCWAIVRGDEGVSSAAPS